MLNGAVFKPALNIALPVERERGLVRVVDVHRSAAERD